MHVLFLRKDRIGEIKELTEPVNVSVSFTFLFVSKVIAFPTRPQCLINTGDLSIECWTGLLRPPADLS